MSREEDFEHALALIVEHVKGLHIILAGLMVDMASLRQMILIEPTDLREYAQNVKAATKLSRPLIEIAMRSYDEIRKEILAPRAPEGEDREFPAAKSELLQ